MHTSDFLTVKPRITPAISHGIQTECDLPQQSGCSSAGYQCYETENKNTTNTDAVVSIVQLVHVQSEGEPTAAGELEGPDVQLNDPGPTDDVVDVDVEMPQTGTWDLRTRG